MAPKIRTRIRWAFVANPRLRSTPEEILCGRGYVSERYKTGEAPMTRPTTDGISPFFIVSNVERTVAFYRDMLGFEATFQEPNLEPFFAIVRRDGAQLLVKSDKAVTPVPNSKRHPYMRWDAYVHAPNPDDLAAEFASHGVAFSAPLQDTTDGLRGFEITDPDGYVLFFGRPR
jgi:catechol 2,3-dioxygenase-like lactoylglutathione lyase family enzyme